MAQSPNERHHGMERRKSATSGVNDRSTMAWAGTSGERVRKTQRISHAKAKSIIARVRNATVGTHFRFSARVKQRAQRGPAMIAMRLPLALARR